MVKKLRAWTVYHAINRLLWGEYRLDMIDALNRATIAEIVREASESKEAD